MYSKALPAALLHILASEIDTVLCKVPVAVTMGMAAYPSKGPPQLRVGAELPDPSASNRPEIPVENRGKARILSGFVGFTFQYKPEHQQLNEASLVIC